jgi:hypothetical protein
MSKATTETFAQMLALLGALEPPTSSDEAKEATATKRKLTSRITALVKMDKESPDIDLSDAIASLNSQLEALEDAAEDADHERGEFLTLLSEVERQCKIIRRRAEGDTFVGDYTVDDADDSPSILDDWKRARPEAVPLTEKGIAAHGFREEQVARAIAFLTKGGAVKTTSVEVDALLAEVDPTAADSSSSLAETYASKYGDVYRRRGKDEEGNSIGVYSVHRA